MKIAIEAQRIFRRKKHGMDFVALELIRMLQKIDTQNEYYILVASGNDKCLTSKGNFQVVEVGGTSNYFLWEQWLLPRALKRIKPDVVHCTSNTAPLHCPYPLVLTLHDIIFLEKKIGKNVSPYQNLGRIYRRFVVPRVVFQARHVITVSDYERRRIQEGLPSASGKIATVYNGVGVEFQVIQKPDSIVYKYIQDRGYWFLLGNTDPKKNLKRTLQAYAGYVSLSVSPRPLLIADLDSQHLDAILQEAGIAGIRSLLSCARLHFPQGYERFVVVQRTLPTGCDVRHRAGHLIRNRRGCPASVPSRETRDKPRATLRSDRRAAGRHRCHGHAHTPCADGH